MSKYAYCGGQKVAFVYNGLEGYGIVRGVSTTELPILGCFYIVEVLNCNKDLPNAEYPFNYITVPELHLEYIRISSKPDLGNPAYISVYTEHDQFGHKLKIKAQYLTALKMMPEPERTAHAEIWANEIFKVAKLPNNLTIKHFHQFIRHIVGVE